MHDGSESSGEKRLLSINNTQEQDTLVQNEQQVRSTIYQITVLLFGLLRRFNSVPVILQHTEILKMEDDPRCQTVSKGSTKYLVRNIDLQHPIV